MEFTDDIEVSVGVVLVVHVEPSAGRQTADDLAVVAGLEGVAERIGNSGHPVTLRNGHRLPVR